MDLSEPALERLRLKLRYKVLYHVGHNCADVDDLVQESLARFIRAEQKQQIRNVEEFGAFLNGVCRNVILEYRRRSRREPPLDPDLNIPETGVRPDADIFEMRNAIDWPTATARCFRRFTLMEKTKMSSAGNGI